MCRLVETPDELQQCMQIRREVFVDEQGLFAESDRDEHDEKALHIAAFYGGAIIGTVRVYEESEGLWWGGRLAVVKKVRGRAGKLLIRKAVEIVKEQGARKFLARVQVENVAFFKTLGWAVEGEPHEYRGMMHQVLKADLG